MTTYLISYDISSDKIRLKISKLLERTGLYRVQKSVFVAPDFEPKTIRLLRQQIALLMQTADDTDSILCVPMTKKQVGDLWWKVPEPIPKMGNDMVVFI